MKRAKQMIAAILIILLIAAFPVQAFAAEAQVATATAHEHNWKFDHYAYSYFEVDSSNHAEGKVPVYKCTVSGCFEVDMGDFIWTTKSHTMSSYAYNYNNYHSGTRHYAEYSRSCNQCGYTESYWDDYPCPGNGNCIFPMSLKPVLTEK